MSNGRSLPNIDPVFYEAMLRLWRDDPEGVDASWAELFLAMGEGAGRVSVPRTVHVAEGVEDLAQATLRRAFRERGHLVADANPLARRRYDMPSDPGVSEYGLSFDEVEASERLSALACDLTRAYCGTLSAEFMYLERGDARGWLANAMESGLGVPDAGQKRHILDLVIAAETFEHFMQTKLPTVKRFGMEGSEAQMPLSERLLECAGEHGVAEVVLGPMHRGRTTFMALFMQKPLAAIFSEFQGEPWHPADLDIAGDVSYHMGYSVDRKVGDRTIHISMASHPSHVETVIPVSLGKTRARLRQAGRDRVLGLMMHTDAGFAGQGVVAECFQLGGLEGYSTGGSIHVIANNQLGFTTRPEDARTSRYCSDMAKIVQAPVLRVNGDDPEAAYRAATIAVEYWKRFRSDIVIDLVCYRRQGHNELDEPRYTQPRMYAGIDALRSVISLYEERLVEERTIESGWSAERRALHRARYEDAFAASGSYKPNAAGRFERHWKGYRHQDLEAVDEQPVTGVAVDTLRAYAKAQVAWPDGFQPNERLRKQLEARASDVGERGEVTWAVAEALAFSSLLAEGTPIRLTGEDTVRGTFSQRHCVVLDEVTEHRHLPLDHVSPGQARIEVHDSPLSEEAVLAFEYGHTLADPETLVVWEAQFGDFANVAQVFIDQYIASGEEKWLRSSGIVLLLPHGLEGGGPEHSSARIERYLQLCAKGNMHVVNCTTPANHFHALRRQMCRDYRKPLIAMTPKLLLRHRHAVSGISELSEGTSFEPVLVDVATPEGASRVILCSGRIYYDLDEVRRERQVDGIAIVRIEELYPFPHERIATLLRAHRGAEVIWCQEEPENMGAWTFVAPRLRTVLDRPQAGSGPLRFVGRAANPSPAPGFRRVYQAQQAALVEDALFGAGRRT